MTFDPGKPFRKLSEFDPSKSFNKVGFDPKTPFRVIPEKPDTKEISSLIKKELAKVKPLERIIERIIEQPIIKTVKTPVVSPPKEIIREVIKVDKTKYAKEETVSEIDGKIKDLTTQLSNFREIVPFLGGSGVIGLPNPQSFPPGSTLQIVNNQWVPVAAAGTFTSTRVPFANVNGQLVDDSDMTFDGTSLRLTNGLVMPSAATGLTAYNTADETTNFERGIFGWASNILKMITSKGGSGVARDINVTTPLANLIIKGAAASPVVDYDINSSASITSFIRLGNGTLSLATSGNISAVTSSPAMAPGGAGSANFRILNLSYTLNGTNGAQSGTGTGVFLNATETNLNGMTHNLMDLQVGSLSKFLVNNAGQVSLSNKITTYSNVTTAGWGVPAIYASGRSTAQGAAVASVATYTVGAADGSFLISANANITAFVAGTFNVQVDYTDETNVARTLTLNFSSLTGTIGIALAAAGPFEGIASHLRCKASTSITVKTTGTFTSLTYNVESSITQIS